MVGSDVERREVDGLIDPAPPGVGPFCDRYPFQDQPPGGRQGSSRSSSETGRPQELGASYIPASIAAGTYLEKPTVVPKALFLCDRNWEPGGAWVAWDTAVKGNPVPVMVMDHYSAGRWTRVASPVKSGYTTSSPSSMELIPGTRSVLGNADLYPSDDLPIGGVFQVRSMRAWPWR